MKESTKALLASYGRSVVAGVTALYMAGVTDPKDLAYSLIAAIIPVALRYANPNDKSFGRLPSADDLASILKKATPKKAPTKKPAAKKTAKK
jgi:hypothetical protein